MSRTTQTERLCKVLRLQGKHQGWHGWDDFAPRDRHSCSQCFSKLNRKGWNILSRKQKGKKTHEYRLAMP